VSNRRIRLAVAIFKSSTVATRPPLLLLGGGPGTVVLDTFGPIISGALARDFTAEPATLVRRTGLCRQGAKIEIGMIALAQLLNGSGYDPEVSLAREAYGHILDAASRVDARDRAREQLQLLVEGPCNPSRRHFQRVLADSLTQTREESVGD
jgi:hypothetical protein